MKTIKLLIGALFILIAISTSNYAISQDFLPNIKSGRILDTKIDNNKRIWIATDRGLILHDGSNYIRINPKQKKYIGQSVNALFLYKRHLYVIYTKAGALRFDIDNYTSTEISDQQIESIAQMDDEHYYILFSNGRIEDRYSGTIRLLTKVRVNIETHSIMSEGPNHSLFLSIPKIGLYQINTRTGQVIKDFGIVPTGYFNSFANLKNRYFFINKLEVLELDHSGNFIFSNYFNKRDNHHITKFLPITDTSMIIVRYSKNTYLIEKESATYFELNKLKNFEISTVLYYNKNNIYIGTNQGIVKVINTEKRVFPLYDTAVHSMDYIRVRRKILPVNKDEFILFGAPFSFLYSTSKNSFSKICNTAATLYDAIKIDDNIYASSEGGGVKKINLKTKSFTSIVAPNFDSTKLYMSILDVHSFVKESALFGTRGRVVLYNYKSNQTDTITLNNQKARVRSLLIDSVTQKVYAGTEDGLYTIDLFSKKYTGKIALKGSFITDIKFSTFLNKQLLWVGSDYGVEAYDIKSGSVIMELPISQLGSAKITAILVDKYQNIWISTYAGIYAFNPVNKNLLRLVNEKQLINFEYNFKSAAVLQNGNLIFGGLNGYDEFDPNLFDYEQKHNQGIITGYSAYTGSDTTFKSFSKNERIVYNSNNNFMQIFFTVNNPEILEYSTFEYKVDSLNWIPIRGVANIVLYKLLDGNHVINIRGTDDLGRTINFDPVLVEYHTPFFQSPYFNYLLLFFLFFLVILFGWSIYKKVNDENKLKEQIAMDLHDEIGTLLTKALYIVKQEENKVGGRVVNYISEALFSIRTYINAINIERCTLNELVDEIKEFKTAYLGANSIEYSLDYQFDKEYEISSSQYRDLKLMCYEINQNAVKHSHASNMRTQIIASDNQLTIIIEDDGDLYNASSIENKGNGIGNLKRRVKRLGGNIYFSTPASGSGLTIKIQANL